MTSFADSEKRLMLALGRIDDALDRAAARPAPAPDHADGAAPPADDEALAALKAENAALKRRLAEANEEAARLVRANEALAAANAGLTDGRDIPEEALRAELDALKAARAAEIAALDDIMSGLEAMIARAPRASDAPYAEDVAPEEVTPASGDVVSFGQNEG